MEDGAGVVEDCFFELHEIQKYNQIDRQPLNCVDTCELLEEHREGGNGDAAEHSSFGEERTDSYELQFVCVRGGQGDQVRPPLCGGTFLERTLSFDFEELELDERVILLKTSQTR